MENYYDTYTYKRDGNYLPSLILYSGMFSKTEKTYFQEKYDVNSYYFSALEYFNRVATLRGKTILELGGSGLPRELVIDFIGASKWICVDILSDPAGGYQRSHGLEVPVLRVEEASNLDSLGDMVVLNGPISRLSKEFKCSFDVILSVNALEHIADLKLSLEKCRSILKENGVFISQHGPIWSSIVGHHYWFSPASNFNNSRIPPWGHLLMTPSELEKYLRDCGAAEAEITSVIDHVYTSPRINRLFFEDYIRIFKESGFRIDLLENGYIEKAPEKTLKQLCSKHPEYKNFESYVMRILACV